jgi:hypothetical protein
MQKLIEILLKETASLKSQYLEMTQQWSEIEFARVQKMREYKTADWCAHFGIEARVEIDKYTNKERVSFPKGFYNTKRSVTLQNLQTKVYSITNKGLQKYTEDCLKEAEYHYNNSINKLALRIEKKALNIDLLKTLTSHVGVNIETTLTDGQKTVRAFTIIASGEVQKPHYRYLIK